MNKNYIAVLDSGVGGLSVLKKLTEIIPNERYLYFGDNLNAPYGSRTKRDLISLSVKNVLYLQSFGIKAIVIACNTLSTTVLNEIRSFANVPVFGIFPPVERCLINNEQTILLSTENTANNYRKISGLTIYPLKNLAKDIEINAFNLDKIDISDYLPDINSSVLHNSTVILGCTHYEFVKNKIINHLKPQKVVSGAEDTARKLTKYLKCSKSLENIKGFEIHFIGDSKDFNKEFWKKVVKQY